MKRYIKLTTNGKESYFFVNHITRVFKTTNGTTGVSGCNNNGFVEVEESIEEVLNLIDNLN